MTPRVGIIGALRSAITAEMENDSAIIVMGNDVEFGVWGVTRGLHARFGHARVRNTPITEYVVTGAAAGAAMTGLRPIVDLGLANFIYAAWDQIADQITKLPYMTNGQLRLPLVLVAAAGSTGSGQHSDVPTAALVNTSCLTVVYVTTPEDAAGLMTAAMRSSDPVILLFPVGLVSERSEAPEVGHEIPLGVARVRREGSDVTCWAPGLMVKRALEAAAMLESEGISVEVIDPRTLQPLDEETVLASVEKTGRFVAADEARGSCSIASEMVARVSRKAFQSLLAPPALVTAPDNAVVPYAPVLQPMIIPSAERLADACRAVALLESVTDGS